MQAGQAQRRFRFGRLGWCCGGGMRLCGLRWLTITDEAAQLIRRHVPPGHVVDDSECVRGPDGQWEVPFSDEAIALLEAAALPGETVSDTVIRKLTLLDHGGTN